METPLQAPISKKRRIQQDNESVVLSSHPSIVSLDSLVEKQDSAPLSSKMAELRGENPFRSRVGKRIKKRKMCTAQSFENLSMLTNTGTAMKNSNSAPSLAALALNSTVSNSSLDTNDTSPTNPKHLLYSILQQQYGIKVQTRPSLQLENFFLETTEQHIQGYTMDVIVAIRAGDVDALKQFHQQGRTLQCSNRFGETIVHKACRRGDTNVIKFLHQQAGVSLRLCDDYGRTPLHDACWTGEPQFELFHYLISECPDMLFLTDKRGFTPLCYVQRQHWDEWCQFLNAHKDILKPREACR